MVFPRIQLTGWACIAASRNRLRPALAESDFAPGFRGQIKHEQDRQADVNRQYRYLLAPASHLTKREIARSLRMISDPKFRGQEGN